MSKRLYILMFFLISAWGICFSPSLSAQCQWIGPVEVEDFDVTTISIAVDSLVNDDLSDPSQGICGVNIEFDHESVGDLRVDMISPAGQELTLIGPTGDFGLTFFTQWDIGFLPCGQSADPDLGFPDIYSNQNAWGVGGTYTGTYYPFSGCFESFNTGSANGIWTFEIRDAAQFYEGTIESISLLFCDPTGIECLDCAAPTPFFEQDSALVCLLDPGRNLPSLQYVGNFDTTFHANRYHWVDGDSMIAITDSLVFPGGVEGETVELCPLVVENRDTTAMDSLATIWKNRDSLLHYADQLELCYSTGDCLFLELEDNRDTTRIDTFICSGEYYVFLGDTLQQGGTYQGVDSSQYCDRLLELHLLDISLNAAISPPDTLNCRNETVVIDGSGSTGPDSMTFLWRSVAGDTLSRDSVLEVTEPGEFQLFVEYDRCFDSLAFSVEQDTSLPTAQISFDGAFTCENDSVQVTLDSTDAQNYFWTDRSQLDTFYTDTLVVFQADTLLLFLEGQNFCTSVDTVVPPVDLEVPEVLIDTTVAFCEGDSFPLQIDGDLSRTVLRWSGPNGFEFEGSDTIADAEGLYFLTATDTVNGCTSLDSFDFQASPLPGIPAVTSDTLDCFQTATQLRVNPLRPDFEYFWLTPDRDTIFEAEPSVDQAGVYTLIIESDQGCINSRLHDVHRSPELPELQIQGDTLTCVADSVTLTLESNADLDGFELYWNTPLQQQIFSDSICTGLPGTYTLVADNQEGCVLTDTFELIEDFSPFDHILRADSLTCRDTTAEISISGGAGFDFTWITPDGSSLSGDTISVERGGPYLVQIESVNCYYERGVVVAVDSTPPVAEIFGQAQNCIRDSGFVLPRVRSGDQLFLFDPDMMDFIPVSDDTLNFAGSGQFRFRWEGDNGCRTELDTVLLADSLPPAFTFNIDSFTCRDSVIQATVEGEGIGEVEWQQGSGGVVMTDTFETQEWESISLKVEGTNGCAVDTLIVPVVDTLPPELPLEQQPLNCTNQQYIMNFDTLDGLAGIRWTLPSGDVESNLAILIDAPGTYHYVATGLNNCVSRDSFDQELDTLLPDPALESSVIPCGRDSLSTVLDFDTGELDSIFWILESGEALPEAEPRLPPGRHFLVIEGNNTCLDTFDFSITRDSLEYGITGLEEEYHLNCNRRTELIAPDVSPSVDSTYWILPDDNRSAGTSLELSLEGEHLLVLIGENLCSDTLFTNVVLDTVSPAIELTSDTLNCREASVEISSTTDAEQVTFDWTGPQGWTSRQPSPTVQNPGWYFVSVTGENGCTSIDSQEVVADFDLPPYELADRAFRDCNSDDYNLRVDSFDGESVAWIDPMGDTLGLGRDLQLEGTTALEFVVAIFTGSNGCLASDTLRLFDEYRMPEAEWQLPQLSCSQVRDSFILTEGDPDWNYEWSLPDGETVQTPSFSVADTGLYIVHYIDRDNCQNRDTFRVEADELVPLIEIRQWDEMRCRDSTGGLSVEVIRGDINQLEFEWSTMGGQILSLDGDSVRIYGAGDYFLKAYNPDSNCVSGDTMEVVFSQPNQWSFGIDVHPVLCREDSLPGFSLTGLPPDLGPYTYEVNGEEVEDVRGGNIPEGSIDLTVIDSQGCARDTNFTLLYPEQLGGVDLGGDRVANAGDSIALDFQFTFDPSRIDSVFWLVNDSLHCSQCMDFGFELTESVVVQLVVVTTGGCVFRDEIFIDLNRESDLFIPNVFSPNGDGRNDIFYILTGDPTIQQIESCRIFDRWGDLVFEQRNFPPNEAAFGWDGSSGSDPYAPQVFTVVVAYRKAGELKIEHTSLTLLR